MKRNLITIFILVLLALPVSAQEPTLTPLPTNPRTDPLAANPANIQSRPQSTPTPPPVDNSTDASDVFGIMSGGASGDAVDTASAALRNVAGEPVGLAMVRPLEEGLFLLQINAWDLPPGMHGFHVHAVGACDATSETPFGAAGSHLGSDQAAHPEHAGDLPALYVTPGGVAGLAVVVDALTLDVLLDEDGSALIVHENPDNYANIPERYGGPDAETLAAGDSGARIACGVFEVSRTVLP